MTQRGRTRHSHHKTKGRSRPRKAYAEEVVEVTGMGARGDGLAQSPQGPLYIPDAVPGDRVRVQPEEPRGDGLTARIVDILTPGPGRIAPPCPHVAACGGCALQHVAAAQIAEFKREQLITALQRQGITADLVGETKTVPPGTRRRIRLTARRLKDATILGFNARRSDRVVDLQTCHLAHPDLVALFPALRSLIGSLTGFGSGGDVQLTRSDTGIELLFIPIKTADPGLAEREALVTFAETWDLARIAWETEGIPEPVVARHPPRMHWSGCFVDLPYGAFLQPSAEGEAILRDLVLAGIPKNLDALADLYAGCGTFSLPLSRRGALVHAVEGNAASVDALRHAAAGLRLTAETRDLAKKPLTVEELSRYQAVIFDPPRAGAAPQAAQLARSTVPNVIAVSCNPATLARDLRSLVDGGYRILRVDPVDQFTWSTHLEAVAVLTRAP